MSAPDSTVIQMNFKTPRGGLFNIYATSVAEAKELTQAFREELLQEIHDTEAVLTAASNMAATSAPEGSAPTQSAAPAAPSAGIPTCAAHACTMGLVPAGISKKTGKPYKAFYACGQPQATSCGQTKPAA